jgi:Tol biopolymer transport system component
MKKINGCAFILLFSAFASCQKAAPKENQQGLGTFMSMKPTSTPLLLFPELIASSLDEYNGTFSPEGKEFFFTTNTPSKGIICVTRLGENNSWSTPKIASFSGVFSEYDPLFSPDGKRLYFSSERAINKEDSSHKTNIWFVEKTDSNWSEPSYLELEMQGTYYSSITKNGDVSFNIWDTGDMYKASQTNDGFKIDTLPAVLNSRNGEGDPFISPAEDYLIFRGYNNSLGQGDLYISYPVNGQWTDPENLGEPINSNAHEMCPYVTLDGKYFIFSSSRIESRYPSQPNATLEQTRQKHHEYDNGLLNIYYISADFISEKRKKHEL